MARFLLTRADYDIQEQRENRARRGRSEEQAYKLRQQTARSASCCADCFRLLAAADSVTLVDRKVWRSRLRVPICLICTLDGIQDDPFPALRQRFRRTRCLNCNRPMRVYGHPPFRPVTCCADCARTRRNHSNKLRRRVEHERMACVECGRSFIPKRADAVTCSNRCRQARHRRAESLGVG